MATATAIQKTLERPRKESLREGGEGLAHLAGVHLVAAADDDDHAAEDRERAERHDDGRDADAADGEAVQETEQGADHQADGDVDDGRQVRAVLADQGRQHAGERQVRSDREIDAAGQDDHHLGERQHEQECGVVEHAEQALALDEGRGVGADGGDHEHDAERQERLAVGEQTAHAARSSPRAPVAAATIASADQAPRSNVADDAALVHDQDAVSQAHHLGQLRGDENDREAGLGELADEVVDGGLGADVDALGRLVQDDDLRPRGEPLGDHHLLLVAAGELGHLLVPARGLDREARAQAAGRLALGRCRQEPALHVAGERGERGVGANAERQDGTLLLAVLRHVGDAGGNGVAGLADVDAAHR